MKQIFTFLTCLFISAVAKAQCTPAPAFSVTMAKAINHPLKIKATLTTGAATGIHKHKHTVNWGDGSQTYTPVTTTLYHDFASPGTYTVKYYLNKIDSTTLASVCLDSVSQSITVAYCAGASGFSASGGSIKGQFNFSTIGSTTGATYSWYFGDGVSTGTGASVSHIYNDRTQIKIVNLYSSLPGCTDTFQQVINPALSGPCPGKTAIFSANNTNGVQVKFYDLTNGNTKNHQWDFGDGNTSTTINPIHVYAAPGNYLVKLSLDWDSTTCSDTFMSLVSVSTTTNNSIFGEILRSDSSIVMSPDYKVWLIAFDSATNILSAVDSLTITGGSKYTPYAFNNVPVGKYRVKAFITNGPTSGTGYVPTYSTNSLSWSTANVIQHYAGLSGSHNITMQIGTATTGPGFIAGDVTLGANKGSGSGVAELDVYLVDAISGMLVKSTKTDANGNYSFTSVPVGMYQIQPELMSFATTPSTPFTISNSNVKVEDMWFTVSNSKKTIKPVPASVTTIALNISFHIYPNPAKNKTTIQWNDDSNTNAVIIITDLAGKTVYSNNVNTAVQTEIDLSQLGKGLYFINIATERIQQTQKLVVE